MASDRLTPLSTRINSSTSSSSIAIVVLITICSIHAYSRQFVAHTLETPPMRPGVCDPPCHAIVITMPLLRPDDASDLLRLLAPEPSRRRAGSSPAAPPETAAKDYARPSSYLKEREVVRTSSAFIAHHREADGTTQSLAAHLLAVAAQASCFAEKIGLARRA